MMCGVSCAEEGGGGCEEEAGGAGEAIGGGDRLSLSPVRDEQVTER